MFRALRGRRWHLAARAIVLRAAAAGAGSTSTAPALGNAFSVPAGALNIAGVPKASPVLLAAVVFAPQFGRVQVTLNGAEQVLPCMTHHCTQQTGCTRVVHSVLQPGDVLNADGLVLPGSYDPKSCSKSPAEPTAADSAAGSANSTRGCATAGSPVVTGTGGAALAISVNITFGVDIAISGPNSNAAVVAFSCPDGWEQGSPT